MSVITWWSFLSLRFVFLLSFVIKTFAAEIGLRENNVNYNYPLNFLVLLRLMILMMIRMMMIKTKN